MSQGFQADMDFLRKYTDVVLLGDPDEKAVVLVPQFQGRVMTSTAGSTRDNSFGWINYDLIRNGQRVPQINLYGGEERFWLSPEGGRFSIFFPPAPLDQALDFADWRVPDCIDTQGFEVVGVNSTEASFQQQAVLVNRAGTEFQIEFQRRVKLLSELDLAESLNLSSGDFDGISWVAHESYNTLINRGDRQWQADTGLLAIWVLGMNAPSPNATLVVPYQRDVADAALPIVNADYFGTLGPDRLIVDHENGVILMRGDGNFRSKLGLTFPRALPWLGAWDGSRRVMTLVNYNLPDGLPGLEPTGCVRTPNGIAYVNNLWRVLPDEYNGDVINGYNDGPNESGSRLGGFFELESLSPGLALAPNQSYTHRHLTVHLEAEPGAAYDKADGISRSLFGLGLEQIKRAFGSS